jgi:hypothetical protein
MTEHEAGSAAQRPDDATEPRTSADAPAPPLVAWGPPPTQPGVPIASTPDGFTVGAILADAFARYAADPIRLFVLGMIPAIASLLGVALAGPQPTTLAAFGPYLFATFASSLLAIALGLSVAAITFALLELGPAGGLGQAVRWGLGRVGWLFATGFLYGLAVFVVLLAFFLPIAILAVAIGALSVLLIVVAVPVVLWISIRLNLAIVATVIDRLDAGRSIRLAWAITKPSGVWWRVFGSVLAIGLLVGPVSILASSLSLIGSVPRPAATLIGVLLLAFVSPLSGSVQYSIYRRLVGPPPAVPAAVTAPDGIVAPVASAAPAARATNAPPLGSGGRAFIGVTVVLAVIGLVSLPLALSAMFSRQLTLQGLSFPGSVPIGTVAFGTSGSLRTCTVLGQTTEAAAYAPIVYMGHFDRSATAADKVELHILRNGTEIANEVEKSGFYQCLGIETPETDIGPGTYDVEMWLNGRLAAHGTLVVH